MTREEINQGNKLIAEFNGTVEHIPYGNVLPGKDAFYYISEGRRNFIKIDSRKDNELQEVWGIIVNKSLYHISWDWLMPVIEKISSLGFTYCIRKNWASSNKHVVQIYRKPEEVEITELAECPLDALYFAVVKFIKWYNENGKLPASNS